MLLLGSRSFSSPGSERKPLIKLYDCSLVALTTKMKSFSWVNIVPQKCECPVRLVSVLWGTTWYRYLTNVLDPQQLSAQQVCDLYRRRWRVEDAFALTKRLLGLAYLWVGNSNGVQIQIYATWILYAVLNDLCAQVAVALHQPLEKISLEMVFRGLYHFAKALERGEAEDVISYFQTHHRLLGLIKASRPRHRQRDALSEQIWGATSSLC